MNQEELSNALVSKLRKGMPIIKILVNGSWGIGKSHVVSELAKGRLAESHFIHLSLFGLTSVDEINQKLKREYLLAKTNTDETFLGKGINALTENKAMRSVLSHFSEKYIGLSIDPMELLPLALNDTFIVCFDDLERKSPLLPIEDALGVIEQIGQQCKVVIIASEEQIVKSKSDWDKYSLFKEKVVDRTYSLDKTDMETIKSMIEMHMPSSENEAFFSDICSYIYDFFTNRGIHNLRTLKKSVAFVAELCSQIDPDRSLTDLCCAIINEDASAADLDKISKNVPGDNKSFYARYDIRPTLQIVLQELIRFYKINQIDKAKINEYLHPTRTECGILLEDLQESWFKNEGILYAHFQRVESVLNTRAYTFFGTCERLIYVLVYLQSCKTIYSLTYDVNALMERAKLAIIYLVNIESTSAMLDIVILEKSFSNVGILTPLLDVYTKEIANRSSEAGLLRYLDAYEAGDYKSCLEVVKEYPMIISSILNTLNLIRVPVCTGEMYLLVTTIATLSRFDKSLLHLPVKNRLYELYQQATDTVIRHRINSVIQNYL